MEDCVAQVTAASVALCTSQSNTDSAALLHNHYQNKSDISHAI